MSSERIPIEDAKQIAKKHGQDQIILLAWDKSRNLTHVVTYGRTKADCTMAAEGGNRIKRFLGWPESACNAQPARVKRRQLKDAEEYRILRHQVLRGMWNEYNACKHCGRSMAPPDSSENPHAPDCEAWRALQIIEQMKGTEKP